MIWSRQYWRTKIKAFVLPFMSVTKLISFRWLRSRMELISGRGLGAVRSDTSKLVYEWMRKKTAIDQKPKIRRTGHFRSLKWNPPLLLFKYIQLFVGVHHYINESKSTFTYMELIYILSYISLLDNELFKRLSYTMMEQNSQSVKPCHLNSMQIISSSIIFYTNEICQKDEHDEKKSNQAQPNLIMNVL